MLRRLATLATVLMALHLPAMAQTLDGAIDMHIHSGPDGSPRLIDALDLTRLAKSKGMRALVLKNHHESTAAQAYLVRKVVPGIEVFGGISLDLSVGGVNPAAVDWMAHMEGGYGKVVWLPTNDSEANVKRVAAGGGRGGRGGRGDAPVAAAAPRPFVSVIRDGKVLPDVLEVFDIIAKNNMVLETGHSSPSESLILIPEAKRHGVKNILVTHAFANPGGSMTIEEAHEAAKMGAFIELVYDPFDDATLQHTADAIHTIGAASFVLSSDLGQRGRPLHPDGLLALYQALAKRGISVAEIDQMGKVNPAKLLGLQP